MFQEGVQIRKLHGDYGVHTEPSLKGRGMKITPKFPIAESRDSSKNQGTCPRPELSPQAQKRKIEPSWPDQASGSAVGRTAVGQLAIGKRQAVGKIMRGRTCLGNNHATVGQLVKFQWLGRLGQRLLGKDRATKVRIGTSRIGKHLSPVP
jgi:hypothetical protein